MYFFLTQIAEDQEIGSFSTNQEKLDSTLKLIMDELIDLSTIKPQSKFDNPFVLSFLANTCHASSFVPPEYYTIFEFRRLTFSATGQLRDPSEDVKKMIIGGLIICRGLCRELLFSCKKYFPDIQYVPEALNNLDILGTIVYNAFTTIVKENTQVAEDNTAIVTLNEEPLPMESGIGWKDEMNGSEATTEELLNGVPDAAQFNYNSEAVDSGMGSFLTNMLRYVQLQAEDERLPLYKKKFESMRELANKGRRTDTDLYNHLVDDVKQKEQDLKIP